MKLSELLEYLNDNQLIEIKFNGLKSNLIEKDEINNEWLGKKVKCIETGITKGYKGYLFNVPDKPFVKIEIEKCNKN